MNRFNIFTKVLFSFLFIIIVVLSLWYFTTTQIRRANDVTKMVLTTLIPLVDELQEIRNLLLESRFLINVWIYNQSPIEDPSKQRLKAIGKASKDGTLTGHINVELKNLNDKIMEIELNREFYERTEIKKIIKEFKELPKKIHQLFSLYHEVEKLLPDFESYSDFTPVNTAREMIESNGAISVLYNTIDLSLRANINIMRNIVREEIKNVNEQFEKMRNASIITLLGIVFISILIAVIITLNIVRPLAKSTEILLTLSRGVIPKNFKISKRNDEIGSLLQASAILIKSFENQTHFANELAKGNFEVGYTPLSEEDILGHSLLKMRDALWESERNLMEKVKERTQQLEERQKELERLYGRLMESLNYARKIQLALLPNLYLLQKDISPKTTILYLPKDVVSGDFFWYKKINDDESLFALMDCTGHGVPGAFMTVVGINALERSVSSLTDTYYINTHEILRKVNFTFVEMLHQPESRFEMIRDGMEGSLFAINKKEKVIHYSSARGIAFLWKKNGNLIQLGRDFVGIGPDEDPNEVFFTKREIKYEEGDILWVTSDGYMDQFGGPKYKRFGKAPFLALINEVSKMPYDQRYQVLLKTIKNWQGSSFQIDDILVVGIEFT